MSLFPFQAPKLVSPERALPGRAQVRVPPPAHAVHGRPLQPNPEDGRPVICFGLGCFWGAERLFWRLPGVWTTAVGYAGGYTPNPTYQEVCSGQTGHTEVVQVVYDSGGDVLGRLLETFWSEHDPTQGMRQGNDVGTQYRSAIFTTQPEQAEQANASRAMYQSRLTEAGHSAITTEIAPLRAFYYAEDYHQQYLHKNPDGYCGLRGLGVSCGL